MPKTRAFSRKPVPGYGDSRYKAPVIEEPAVTKSWEEQKAEEALAYLYQQREAEVNRPPTQEPFHYMPTVIGEVMGGRISISLLTVNELTWWADWYTADVKKGENAGDAEWAAKARQYLAPAVAELNARGVAYPPVTAAPSFSTTLTSIFGRE